MGRYSSREQPQETVWHCHSEDKLLFVQLLCFSSLDQIDFGTWRHLVNVILLSWILYNFPIPTIEANFRIKMELLSSVALPMVRIGSYNCESKSKWTGKSVSVCYVNYFNLLFAFQWTYMERCRRIMKASNARTRKHSSMLTQLWYMPKHITEVLKYAGFWSDLMYNIFHWFPLVKTVKFSNYTFC